MTTSILIIEDDQRMAAMLAEYLQLDGFRTTCLFRVNEFLPQQLMSHQLVLLDLTLGQDSGFELLKQIRQESEIPVIVVSAKSDDSDKLLGFRLGADDYLTKPYNHLELVARIHAVLKRQQPLLRTRVPVNNFLLDLGAKQLLLENQPLELTSLEYRIVELLVDNLGETVNRDTIYRQALGQNQEFESRALDVHISNLRRKLGKFQGCEQIKTVRGRGYCLVNLGS